MLAFFDNPIDMAICPAGWPRLFGRIRRTLAGAILTPRRTRACECGGIPGSRSPVPLKHERHRHYGQDVAEYSGLTKPGPIEATSETNAHTHDPPCIPGS